MQKNIKSKVVMVTGAGGSIGSQLCREIIKIKPKKFLLLDSNEFALYTILNEIKSEVSQTNIEIIPILSSIQDRNNLDKLLKHGLLIQFIMQLLINMFHLLNTTLQRGLKIMY